jgi:hypothetical protein
MRRIIANSIVGSLLPEGAVKGGASLKIRYGENGSRFSTDLDVARVGELDAYMQALEAALHTGWYGFTGRLVRKQPPRPSGVPSNYVMKPYDIKVDYNTKPWITVPLEVGHDEIGDADNPDFIMPLDANEALEKLGFPPLEPIPVMRLEHQIAQKLHALTAAESDRVHDLIDLQIIASNNGFDMRQTKLTCMRLFAYSKQQTWPPFITPRESWRAPYTTQANNLPVIASFDEAIKWLNSFVRELEAA